MVYVDPYEQPRNDRRRDNRGSGNEGPALPLDRLAAHVADLVLLVPLMALAMAPFRRAVMDARILGDERAADVGILKSIFAAILLGILWDTVLIAWRGTSPGRAIFGLRVVDVWTGDKPRLLHAFARSVTWWMSLLFMGAPFFGVYGNERRRPLHDRVGDTEVRTRITRRHSPPPRLSELAFGSFFTSASLFCASLVIVGQMVMFNDHSAESAEARRPKLCERISTALDEWDIRDAKPTRIGVALGLSAADTIDTGCLEAEANYALWNDSGRLLGYLAKGIIRFDHERDEAESYFAKVCELEPDSDACRLGQWYRGIEATDEPAAALGSLEVLVTGSSKKESSMPEWWRLIVLRELLARGGDADLILRLTHAPAKHQLIGARLVEYRARALWRLDRKNEARNTVFASIDSLPRESRIATSSWLCGRELYESSCGPGVKPACDVMDRSVDAESGDLLSASVFLASLRYAECRERDGDVTTNFVAQMTKHVDDPSAQRLLNSLRQLRMGEEEQGLEELRDLASNSGDPTDPFYAEANIRLIEFLANRPARDGKATNEFEELRDRWLAARSGRRFGDWGRALFLALEKRHEWRLASSVGATLVNTIDHDQNIHKRVAVAAWKAGNKQVATAIVSNLERSRAPASTVEKESKAEIDTAILEAIRRAAGGRL